MTDDIHRERETWLSVESGQLRYRKNKAFNLGIKEQHLKSEKAEKTCPAKLEKGH